MNAGTTLQARWRWNGRPLRVQVDRIEDATWNRKAAWRISWHRWNRRRLVWEPWRSYSGSGSLAEVISRYRDAAGLARA